MVKSSLLVAGISLYCLQPELLVQTVCWQPECVVHFGGHRRELTTSSVCNLHFLQSSTKTSVPKHACLDEGFYWCPQDSSDSSMVSDHCKDCPYRNLVNAHTTASFQICNTVATFFSVCLLASYLIASMRVQLCHLCMAC